jgi:hypothetical protein
MAFLTLILFAQGLAEGFVLCIGPGGKMAVELESAGCAGEPLQGKHGPSAPLDLHCDSDRGTSCCVDLSFMEEFPPLPSTSEKAVVPSLVITFLILQPLPPFSRPPFFQRDFPSQGKSPLGPNPLATIRLTI